jgi:hypothetical protein
MIIGLEIPLVAALFTLAFLFAVLTADTAPRKFSLGLRQKRAIKSGGY